MLSRNRGSIRIVNFTCSQTILNILEFIEKQLRENQEKVSQQNSSKSMNSESFACHDL